MVRGFGIGGQTGESGRVACCTAGGTLLLGDLRLAHVREKTRVGGTAPGVVEPGFGEAQFAVYGVADFCGVGVFLAVVLPPADGT